jgi:hypothetical protein
MKPKDVVRAQFLLSPYNVREAKRAREIRNAAIGIGLVIGLLVIGGAVFAFLQR